MIGISVAIGKQRFTEAPRWPSENGYIVSINRQARGLELALRRIFKAFEDVSADIMIEALRPTFAMTQVEVPRDTGALAASGYLEKGSLRGKPRVEIGYGYRSYPWYTQLVHENLATYHRSPEKAKFLQDPVMHDLNNIYVRIGQHYKQFMAT